MFRLSLLPHGIIQILSIFFIAVPFWVSAIFYYIWVRRMRRWLRLGLQDQMTLAICQGVILKLAKLSLVSPFAFVKKVTQLLVGDQPVG